MGVFEGLLSGFNARKSEIESENLKRAEAASAREAKIFEALLASPDPETRTMALTGLLDSANPKKRKGGLRGWMGELEASPYLGRIQELIGTPVTEQKETLPTTSFTGGVPSIQDMPGEQPAAMPAEDVVTPGAPPPTPTSVAQTAPTGPPAPAFKATTQPPEPYSVSRPREVILSAEEQTLRTRKATAQGDVEGEVAGLVAAGFSEEEARNLVKQNYLNKTTGSLAAQSVAGEAPDAQGTFAPVFGVFRRDLNAYVYPGTDNPIPGFRPRTTTGSRSLGTYYERAARSLGFDSGSMVPDDQTDKVNAEATRLLEEDRKRGAFGAGIGTGEAAMQTPADLGTSQTTGVAVGTTAAQVAGQRVPSAAERSRREGVVNVKASITDIRDRLLGVLPKQSDLIGGILPGAVWAAKRRSRNDREAAAALEAAVNNIVNVVARSVAEQRGTQTEQDATRAEAAILTLRDNILLGDTQESARRRIEETLLVLDRVLQQLPTLPVPTDPTATPATAAPGADGLDAPMPGWFVDDQGNLIQR